MNYTVLRRLIRETLLLELRSTEGSPVPSDSKYFARLLGDGFVIFYGVGSDGSPEAIPGTLGYFYDSTYVRGAKPVSGRDFELNPEELKNAEDLTAAGLYAKTENQKTDYPDIIFKYRKNKPGAQSSSWKSPEDVPKTYTGYSPKKPGFEFLLVDTEKGEVSLDSTWKANNPRRSGGKPGDADRNKTYVIPSGNVSFTQKGVGLQKLLSYLSSVDPRVQEDFKIVSPDDKFKGKTLGQVAKAPRATDVVMGTTGTITAYHGTSTSRWSEIEKKGLNPGKFEKFYADLVRGYSDKNVYLTLDPHTAENYATRAAVWDDANALILKVEVPDPARIVADEDAFKEFQLDREYTLTQTQRKDIQRKWDPDLWRWIDVVTTEPGGKVTIEKTQHAKNILNFVRLANRSITGDYNAKDIADAPEAGPEWEQDEEYAALLKDISRKLVGFITRSLTGLETFAYRGRIPPKFIKKWKEYPRKAYPKGVEGGDDEAYEKTRAAVLKKTKTYGESVSSLKHLIREMLLAEAAFDPQRAANEGYRFELTKTSWGKGGWDISCVLGSKEVGKISIALPLGMGECLGAYEVMSVYSKVDGMGPLLYDIALELAGPAGLMSDRRNVSPDARKVWRRYFEGRPDVIWKQLDNFRNVLTPEDPDNCNQSSAIWNDDELEKLDTWDGEKPPWVRSPLSKVYYKQEGTPTIDSLQALKSWQETK